VAEVAALLVEQLQCSAILAGVTAGDRPQRENMRRT